MMFNRDEFQLDGKTASVKMYARQDAPRWGPFLLDSHAMQHMHG
jgi:hypothetical protein